MQTALKDILQNKYIICSCEGVAESAIIKLLLKAEKLCFKECDLVGHEVTRIRKAEEISETFLKQEYTREIVILRIVDREKDNFQLPKIYRLKHNINVINIVTKPEIEIVHIIAENLRNEFERKKRSDKNLKPNSFCKAHIDKNIKSEVFIEKMYGDNIEKLINAIKQYASASNQSSYCLNDLLI